MNRPIHPVEPMNPIVYHIAGGGSFFTGVLLMLVGVGMKLTKRRLWKRVGNVAFCLGVVAVAVSSTPLPYWVLALTIMATLFWIVMGRTDEWRIYATTAFALVWCSAAAWEAWHWITPRPAPVEVRTLTVIGDSVTAGVGANTEATWPERISQRHRIDVDDQSGSGFTTSQALARAEFEGVQAPLVIVEIGGNDLLGGRSSAELYRDLDALLAFLSALK